MWQKPFYVVVVRQKISPIVTVRIRKLILEVKDQYSFSRIAVGPHQGREAMTLQMSPPDEGNTVNLVDCRGRVDIVFALSAVLYRCSGLNSESSSMKATDVQRRAAFSKPALVLACCATTALAIAAELKDVQVTIEEGRYYVVAEMTIDAPLKPTFEALVEYDRFDESSGVYVKTHYLDPAADGTPRIFTRVEGCALGFCRGVERTARLEATPLTRVVATVESELTDNLLYGREIWELYPSADGGTLIIYHHELELGFWLPPLVGPWAVRRALWWGASDVVQTLENMALQGAYTALIDSPCCQGSAAAADAALLSHDADAPRPDVSPPPPASEP